MSATSADAAKKVDHKDNQKDGAKPNARASTVPPAAVPVIPTTGTHQQQKNNDDDQHGESPIRDF
jgi:hypothetical protein